MFDMNRRLLLAAALTTLCASVHWTSNVLICHRFVSGYSLHGCQNPVKGPTPSIIIPLSHSVNTYQDFWSVQMLINKYPYSVFEAWKVRKAKGQIWPRASFQLLWFFGCSDSSEIFHELLYWLRQRSVKIEFGSPQEPRREVQAVNKLNDKP